MIGGPKLRELLPQSVTTSPSLFPAGQLLQPQALSASSCTKPVPLSVAYALSAPAHRGNTARNFFAAITVMADRPSSFLLPSIPRDHMLKAMKIWLLMQFCNDRDHNQQDIHYGLLKMRQRLPFTASPCHHQSYDFLVLPLGWCTTSASPSQLCPMRRVILPSTGVVPSVAGKQSITYAVWISHSGTRLAGSPP